MSHDRLLGVAIEHFLHDGFGAFDVVFTHPDFYFDFARRQEADTADKGVISYRAFDVFAVQRFGDKARLKKAPCRVGTVAELIVGKRRFHDGTSQHRGGDKPKRLLLSVSPADAVR